MINKKKLTRKELYNLVWAKPLTTLAKEFNYSDNGLRKICMKHDIPLPKAGYWLKIKFNKKIVKEKLPSSKVAEDIEITIRQEGQPSTTHINSARAILKKEIENNKELPLIVPNRLSNPEQLIVKAKEELNSNEVSRWGTAEGLVTTSTNSLNIEVSKANISRALCFMNTFIKLIKKRGHTIKIERGTFIIIDSEELEVRLREYRKRVDIKESRWSRTGYQPTGELSFKIQTYPEKIWRDGKNSNIEEKLATILTSLELMAKKNREERIKREAWHKEYQRQEAIKKELQKKKDKELENFNKLFDTATRWHKSQYIRNYIKEFENHAISSNKLDDDKKSWIKWAIEKADWYDPFVEKEVTLLEDIDRQTLEPKRKKWYYYPKLY